MLLKMMFLKKAVYEKRVAKVNDIGKYILARNKNTSTVITSDFVLKCAILF